MAIERLVKRIVYTAKCKCGKWEKTVADNPPTSTMCPECGIFCEYTEHSWTGSDKLGK